VEEEILQKGANQGEQLRKSLGKTYGCLELLAKMYKISQRVEGTLCEDIGGDFGVPGGRKITKKNILRGEGETSGGKSLKDAFLKGQRPKESYSNSLVVPESGVRTVLRGGE